MITDLRRNKGTERITGIADLSQAARKDFFMKQDASGHVSCRKRIQLGVSYREFGNIFGTHCNFALITVSSGIKQAKCLQICTEAKVITTKVGVKTW